MDVQNYKLLDYYNNRHIFEKGKLVQPLIIFAHVTTKGIKYRYDYLQKKWL